MSDRCDYGDDFNALLREEDAERAKERPRIEITREQARVICETYEKVVRGTVAFLSSSTVESMKAVVEAALNGDSK